MIHVNEISKMLREAADALEAAMPQIEKPDEGAQLEDVRIVLVRKSTEGKREAVKDLITKYGAERLSDISPDAFVALLREAAGRRPFEPPEALIRRSRLQEPGLWQDRWAEWAEHGGRGLAVAAPR